jgi:hypothetical protein
MEFDCLYARGKDLRGQPLYVRREWLKDVIHGRDLVLPARRLADDGLTAWAGLLARLPQHRHERHQTVLPRKRDHRLGVPASITQLAGLGSALLATRTRRRAHGSHQWVPR